MADKQIQIVYVLTNPAMAGLVKIGMTTQLEVEERMKQLYGTGVPVPFDCAFACKVRDANEVERALHLAFGMTRINPNREFFRVEPERVIAILRLLEVDEITSQVEQALEADVPAADKQSSQTLKRSMRPRMNFHELGIPNGSILTFRDGGHQVEVIGEKTVRYDGNECSLTAATRKVFGYPANTPLQPSPYWTYNGSTVKEIYENFHSNADES